MSDFVPEPSLPQDYRAEVVLVDGRFARMERHITTADVIASNATQGNATLAVAILASRVVSLDGKPIAFEELTAMDWIIAAPIMQMVNNYLLKVVPFLRGIS